MFHSAIVDTNLCHIQVDTNLCQLLGLTTREFANVFEFSQASLNALENGRTSGKDILKRLEIILNFPSVAIEYLIFNRGHLIYDKWISAMNELKKRESSLD